MSLLRDIQEAAVDNTESITNLLRRCKILAARLGSTEFAEWVERELNGYERIEDLPPYRKIDVRSLGHFVGAFGRSLRNAPIPAGTIPKEYRHFVNESNMLQPISAFEDLLQNGESGTFQSPWPADLTALVGQRIYDSMNCIGAWQEIPRGSVVSLIDSVRNKVLSFVLEVERLAPAAGEAAPGEVAIAKERVQQVFHTTIVGNVGNVAPGASNPQQTVGALITQGDYSSLAEQLRGLGISEGEINDLKGAITADNKSGKPRIGARIGQWIGKALGKAGEGALKVSVDTASAVLPKLISGYLGLPPA